MRIILALCLVAGLFAATAEADGPQDNISDNVRRVPRLGVEVSDQQRKELQTGLAQLQQKINRLADSKDVQAQTLLPDVKIFHRAVADALRFQEFFKPNEVTAGLELLKTGQQRADDLLTGKAPWTDATGLVVRGYVSKIDGSVQPYGLVVPANYSHRTNGRYRLDVWFHGRGETLSEVNFLTQRQKQVGQFDPADTIVLHPYGRYSNAFKFAGEVDVLEAIDSVRAGYRVDDNRTSVRGFSMGGAACWQFAVHYSDRWFAANPGAGFAETPEFLKFFQKETLNPTWYEEKLWRLYDCNLWAKNLVHCPTVAYSGENDIQKQAADIMEDALSKLDIKLVHIIGPQMGHKYHPDSKADVQSRLDHLALKGREPVPQTVSLTTYTLKYNRSHWVTIDALGEHWEQANVEAHIVNPAAITLTTRNVKQLTMDFPSGWAPLSTTRPIQITINGSKVAPAYALSDRSFTASLHQADGQWRLGKPADNLLSKRHNLQGPIDDALMDSFIFVVPTSEPANGKVGEWAASEMKHAIEHWRRHFRGHARVKKDSEITADDIASANLILWGDFQSNTIFKSIAGKLPIDWDEKGIRVGRQTYPVNNHALIAIYPNPLNPQRYVVLNSSFTYREFAYLNNARQVPKLPDWAVVNIDKPADSLWPGDIVDADFFDEYWQLKKK